MKTLSEILAALHDLDDDATVAAVRPWTADSPAVCSTDYAAPVTRESSGLVYLLEVNLAKEVVEVWRNWHGGREPALSDVVRAVIYYAEHDAYISDSSPT